MIRRVSGNGLPVGLARQDRRERVADRLGSEGRSAGQQFIEDAPERPDVGPGINWQAARLFGAHVSGGAEHRAGARARRRDRDALGSGFVAQGLGEPEVEHLHGAVRRQLDVGGFEIAVDDALFVRGFESAGELERDRHNLRRRERTRAQPVGECRPFNQFEHERGHTVCLFEAVDTADVRVIQSGDQPGFTGEPCHAVRVCHEGGREHLDRDVTVEHEITGAIDLAHAPLTDGCQHLVAAQPRAAGDHGRRPDLRER